MIERNDSKAAAYLRRSRVDESRPGSVSYESQEQAVRAMAQRHGFADPVILVDWGRSGGSERKRPQFATLRTMIESGEVRDVFAYDLSRLTRSLEGWVRLATLCREHGTRVHLAKEGTFDFSTASGEMLANILASVAQAVRRWASERSAETVASLRARGEPIGRRPYGSRPGEDVAAVTDAYTEAGSFYGAARLLNERNLPTLRGKAWTQSSVAWIVRHQAPGLAPDGPAGGTRRTGRFALSGLVRCHCGRLLTPYMYANGRNPRYTVYRCGGGRTTHSRPYAVHEGVLLDWARAESAHLRPLHPKTGKPIDAIVQADQRSAERAEFDGRKARILDMFEAGHLTREQREARLAPVYAALERLEAEQAVESILPVGPVDWSKPPEVVNSVLRRLWRQIEVDEHLRPVRADWIVPEWRAA
jgi:DNA invertase Pin-like site-specific DNA recombinase